MSETEFVVPRTLSAMAKKFFVKQFWILSQGGWYLKPGSVVTGIKPIARGMEIREVNRLVDMYPLPDGQKTRPEDWIKVRGNAIITDGEKEVSREVHWYQCVNIGKVEFKVKSGGGRYEDDV